MASRNSKSSGGGSMSRSEAASKGAKATMQPTEMKTERAKGSNNAGKRSSTGGEKKSSGSKSSK
jgi:hypothetical protein